MCTYTYIYKYTYHHIVLKLTCHSKCYHVMLFLFAAIEVEGLFSIPIPLEDVLEVKKCFDSCDPLGKDVTI